ncbi:transcriptional regulator PpsR [Niveispirillum lacus]|uniref:Transcriptional regulator PpsR n=1 Tax=Niveispirillum lacus TaxID=1981099 RepID=A0A255YZI8_9PROT|nr:transcriptional regulator PpsR [Niveispirillum lacus]OYQ34591.1 transcriptional regulator PpsR [Niveispirillum lacus]
MKPVNGKSAMIGAEIAVSLLKSLDTESLVSLICLGADLVLLVDKEHKVVRVAFTDPEIGAYGISKGVGRRLQDLVTIESVAKIDAMLSGRNSVRHARGYQVNHGCEGKPDLPVLYTSYTAEGFPYTLVIGRELRQQMQDQQRLVETQMELEADYRELQEAEARYRTAFRVSTIAHIMLDGERKTVLDANAAAISLIGGGVTGIVGKPFRDLFRKLDRDALSDAIGEARHSAGPVRLDSVRTVKGEPVSLNLRSYRENGVTNLIISAWQSGDAQEARRQLAEKRHERPVDLSDVPEPAVQTNDQGQIIGANALFLDLAQAPSTAQVLGRNLGTWFSKTSLDLHVFYSRLAEEQVVRGFATTLTDNLSGDRPVLVSARRNPETSLTQVIFVPQPVISERLAIPAPGAPEQADGFAHLVGRVPLKDLVRESLEVIEKICIEAALDQTNNNRASAAEMLGLSRQSLYIKLRRHGLEDYRPSSN